MPTPTKHENDKGQVAGRAEATCFALVKWCDTVTAALTYLNDLPQDVKADLVNDLQKVKAESRPVNAGALIMDGRRHAANLGVQNIPS